MRAQVQGFFDEATFTVSYVVADPASRHAAIIDPVLDFDPVTGGTGRKSADALLRFVDEQNLRVDWVLDTHVHADHLTALDYVSTRLGAPTGIGAGVVEVQEAFRDLFGLDGLSRDGSEFVHRFDDNETFALGELQARVLATPGHTPGCVTYVIGDAAFVGDTLFMPDYGTARTDFPGGDAGTLYDSIQRIFSLPDETRLFMCHDYKAPGRDEFAWETTVAEQRAHNVHIHDGVSREEFVAMREGRDAELGTPRLLLPSLQVNIRAGRLPEPAPNGISYIKLPLDKMGSD